MQTQIINLSIPKPLLKALDKQAKKDVKTRSEALRDAVRLYISQRKGWEDLFLYGKDKSEKLGIKSSQVEKIVDEYRSGK